MARALRCSPGSTCKGTETHHLVRTTPGKTRPEDESDREDEETRRHLCEGAPHGRWKEPGRPADRLERPPLGRWKGDEAKSFPTRAHAPSTSVRGAQGPILRCERQLRLPQRNYNETDTGQAS
ncbi:uncharacterized protein LOC144334974 [Macaca mulatta]